MESFRIKNISDIRVLILGDLMLDHYIFGYSKRLSPEAPVPVVSFESERFILGGCGNLLRNLRSFGVDCGLLSVVGEDNEGRILLDHLNKLEVDVSGVFTSKSRPTTLKKRIISGHQQIVRLDTESTEDLSDDEESFVLNKFSNDIHHYNLVVISDYSKGMISSRLISQVIKECAKLGTKVFVDPKKIDFSSYANISLIKPNLFEAELAFGKRINTPQLMEEACKFFISNFFIDSVVLTMGDQGIFYSTREECGMIDSYKVNISDVSGAGDTVMASLVLCLALGMNMKEAVSFANAAASLVVQKFGSEVTTVEEVLKQISYEK